MIYLLGGINTVQLCNVKVDVPLWSNVRCKWHELVNSCKQENIVVEFVVGFREQTNWSAHLSNTDTHTKNGIKMQKKKIKFLYAVILDFFIVLLKMRHDNQAKHLSKNLIKLLCKEKITKICNNNENRIDLQTGPINDFN